MVKRRQRILPNFCDVNVVVRICYRVVVYAKCKFPLLGLVRCANLYKFDDMTIGEKQEFMEPYGGIEGEVLQ